MCSTTIYSFRALQWQDLYCLNTKTSKHRVIVVAILLYFSCVSKLELVKKQTGDDEVTQYVLQVFSEN